MENDIVIFDLDGTLANQDHRRHFVDGSEKNWDAYLEACLDDLPIEPMIELCYTLRESYETWIVTGRSDQVRKETVDWLFAHSIDYDALLMRKAGDYRPDYVIKEEMAQPFLHRIRWVFEDRNQTVAMWRRLGITCLQVCDGDY